MLNKYNIEYKLFIKENQHYVNNSKLYERRLKFETASYFICFASIAISAILFLNSESKEAGLILVFGLGVPYVLEKIVGTFDVPDRPVAPIRPTLHVIPASTDSAPAQKKNMITNPSSGTVDASQERNPRNKNLIVESCYSCDAKLRFPAGRRLNVTCPICRSEWVYNPL